MKSLADNGHAIAYLISGRLRIAFTAGWGFPRPNDVMRVADEEFFRLR